jgi:hypothetical protein
MFSATKQKHSYKNKHPELAIEEEVIEGAGVGASLGVANGAITSD